MLSLTTSLLAGIILLTSLSTATPYIAARADKPSSMEFSISPLQPNKPNAPDPLIQPGEPLPTGKTIFSHFGEPMAFHNVATAVVDAMGWIFAETAHLGKKENEIIPGATYKRSQPSYEIDIGSDLYSERDMTYTDLYLVLRVMFQFAREYNTREFRIQWIKAGVPHIIGELRNPKRFAGSGENGTNFS